MIETGPAMLNILNWAKRKASIQELKLAARHSTDVTQSFELTMKNLDFLLAQGLVRIEDQCLVLGELKPFPWLKDELLRGDKVAWEIADLFQMRDKKFDPDLDLLAEIGLRGELFVMETLRRELPDQRHSEIVHVSLTDDTLGFDIKAPMKPDGSVCFLEVKASTRPVDSFSFFLSRNEWRQSCRLKNWYLVLVSLTGQKASIFGHLGFEGLQRQIPRDQHRDFEWQSVKGVLGRDDVCPGLPTEF